MWNESAWFAMLTGAAIKSTLVLGAAWLLTHTLRRRSAAARHLVWTAAAAALLALPVLSVSLPALRVRNGALRQFVPSVTFHTSVTDKNTATSSSLPASQARAAQGRSANAWSPDYKLWITMVWAVGTILGLGQILLAGLAMRRLRRASEPVADSQLFHALATALGIRHRVDLIELAPDSMPMNFGVFRPTVFLPEGARTWSAERRRVVLLHELAHVKRGDVATNLMMRAALSFYWWNPLAWTAWRESVKERERAADDLVLAAGEAATRYASHLLEIARSMQTTTPLAWAAIAMARPSQLEGRLLAILDSKMRRSAAGPKAAALAGLTAVAIMAPIAALQAQDKDAAPVVAATIQAATAQNNNEITDAAAAAFAKTRKFDAAQTLLEQSLSIRATRSGETGPAYAAGLIKLGNLAAQRGKVDDAVDFYTRAVALGDTVDTAPGLIFLAVHSLAKKDLISAESYIDRALKVLPAGAESGHALSVKADIELANGLAGVAETNYLKALSQQPSNSPAAALTMEKYALMLMNQQRVPEASVMLERAKAIHQDQIAEISTHLTADASPMRVGNGISAPVLVRKAEPEYTEEARAAKFQGTSILSVTIGTDGLAHDIQVVRSLGFGLDEKAAEAVTQWQFAPGKRNGVPVAVTAQIEVNFRLL